MGAGGQQRWTVGTRRDTWRGQALQPGLSGLRCPLLVSPWYPSEEAPGSAVPPHPHREWPVIPAACDLEQAGVPRWFSFPFFFFPIPSKSGCLVRAQDLSLEICLAPCKPLCFTLLNQNQ